MTNLTTWVIDPLHSEVQFKIKHLVISTVIGSFRKFEGKIITEGSHFNNANVSTTIDVKSIDTNQSQRDEHLKSGDFFSADVYPKISFESTSFENIAGNDYKMSGNLTLKGVTKTIELNVGYGGSEDNGHGVLKHGFEINDTINGIELAARIKNYCSTPIIFVTSHIDKETFWKAKLTTPHAFITKPYETRSLQIAIELALLNADRTQPIAQNSNAQGGSFFIKDNGSLHKVNPTDFPLVRSIFSKLVACARN